MITLAKKVRDRIKSRKLMKDCYDPDLDINETEYYEKYWMCYKCPYKEEDCNPNDGILDNCDMINPSFD